MSEAYIADAREHLRVGQTVKAWILSIEEKEKRLRLSLKDQSYWSQGGESAFQNLEEGSIVEANVSAKLTDKLILDLLCGEIRLRGVINIGHLADTPGAKCEKQFTKIREGTKLKEVLVLSKNTQHRIITCSVKPTLIEAAKSGRLPSKYEDLYPGRKVVGWVKNMENFGAFVGFGGSVQGVVKTAVGPFLFFVDIRIYQTKGLQIHLRDFKKDKWSLRLWSRSMFNNGDASYH